jgi:hypothetical protein
LVEAHNGKVGAQIHNDETRVWFSLPLYSDRIEGK